MLTLLAQLAAAAGDVEGNAARLADSLERHPEVDLAVFPELFLCGYALADLASGARPLDAPELGVVAEAAARHRTAVVVGFAEAHAGRVANSAACIDERGELVGVYRKAQLFGGERRHFVPGEELLVAPLAGRRVGVLICFDVEFPELARQLALAGADLLVTVSANMEPYYADHELATRARALDNRLPHLYANLVGAAEGLEFVGGSRSIGPDGEVLAESAHRREELLVAPVPPAGRPADEVVDYLAAVPPPLAVVATYEQPDPTH
ncbi:MAG TPA: nitrilase-related carbon-nitrogen hydrolase [Solirubrobacteraceae bacterium]